MNLFVFVLGFLACLVNGIVIDSHVEIEDKNTIGITVDTFFFDAGGYVDVNITEIESDYPVVFGLSMVSSDVMKEIYDVCDGTLPDHAISYVEFNETGISTRIDVPEKNTFNLVVTFCQRSDDIEFRVQANFMNPNNSNLGLGQVGMPYVYIVFMVLWFGALVYWLVNWFMVKGIHRLHVGITVYIITSVISLLFNALVWFSMYKTGDANAIIFTLSRIFSVLYDCAFFTVLLLIASGWGIVDNKMPKKMWQLVVVIVIYGISLIGSYYNALLGVVSAITLFAVLLLIWHRFGKTYESLSYKLNAFQVVEDLIKKSPNGHIKTVENANEDGSINENSKVTMMNMEELEDLRTQVRTQSRQLHRFYRVMLIYIIGQIIIMVIEMMSKYEWVNNMFYCILDFGIIIYMQFLFRLHGEKRKNMYFRLETMDYGYDEEDEIEPVTGPVVSPTDIPTSLQTSPYAPAPSAPTIQ